MIYKYRDRDFTGIDGHMFVHNGITEENTPFYIHNLSNQVNTLNITKSDGSTPTLVVEKSTDSFRWERMEVVNDSITTTVPVGGILYLRCNTPDWKQHRISMVGDFEVCGNIMSLLYGENYTGGETIFPTGSTTGFTSLFRGCIHLIHSSKLILPATTLIGSCYSYMFGGCENLLDTPALPATTLAGSCYKAMFTGCESIIEAPALPATTLKESCYWVMFQDCNSLIKAPSLPATTLANYCYDHMFSGCTSLVNAPDLPGSTLKYNCYLGMFSGCTSLTKAPDLLAETLVGSCYARMFDGCTSLNSIKCMASDLSASNCLYEWVNGVNASGTFTKLYGKSWPSGTSGIPTGWTVQNA